MAEIASTTRTFGDHRPAELEALIAEYNSYYHPVGSVERLQVDTLIQCEWQLRCLRRAEAQIWNSAIAANESEKYALARAFCENQREFMRIQSRTDAAQRLYRKALRELERLRSARRMETRRVKTPLPESPARKTRKRKPDLADFGDTGPWRM
jgi:hypothetical protein